MTSALVSCKSKNFLRWHQQMEVRFFHIRARATDLVISESHQDDVWLVNPHLQGRQIGQRSVGADPSDPIGGVHAGAPMVTAEDMPTQRYSWWLPRRAGDRARGERVRMLLPFSGVFLWCGKAAWSHRSTWPPDAHFPAFSTPERILENTREGCLVWPGPLCFRAGHWTRNPDN